MHTLIMLTGGVILLGLLMTFGWLWHMTPFSTPQMLKLFIPVWFGIASWNMWKGVEVAGYSFREELIVFPQVFLPPVVLALAILKWS